MSITDKQIREVVNVLTKKYGVTSRHQYFRGEDIYDIGLEFPMTRANFTVEGIRSGKVSLKRLVEVLDHEIENCSSMMRGRMAADWFQNGRRVDFMFGTKEDAFSRAERIAVRLMEASDVLMTVAKEKRSA